MKPAVLAYPHSDNLGDLIQSIAAKKLLSETPLAIDREALHTYAGEPVHLILNGWFMENAQHWPPSEKIKPLFISFHINPTVAEVFTQPKSITYFKRHQPIGCRDLYTKALLEKNGVEAYFSGCLTLTLNRQDFINKEQKHQGILLLSVLERLKPKKPQWNTQSLVKDFLLQGIKYPFKSMHYAMAQSRLNRFLKQQKWPIIEHSQITDNASLPETEKEAMAVQQLEAIASARCVITSRIHSALPAVAMGVPVLFLQDGLSHINQRSRLLGLNSLFTVMKTKALKHVQLEALKNPKGVEHLVVELKRTISAAFA